MAGAFPCANQTKLRTTTQLWGVAIRRWSDCDPSDGKTYDAYGSSATTWPLFASFNHHKWLGLSTQHLVRDYQKVTMPFGEWWTATSELPSLTKLLPSNGWHASIIPMSIFYKLYQLPTPGGFYSLPIPQGYNNHGYYSLSTANH